MNFSITRIRFDFNPEQEEFSFTFGGEANAVKLTFSNWTNGLKLVGEVKAVNQAVVNIKLIDNTALIKSGQLVDDFGPVVAHKTILETLETFTEDGPVKPKRGRPKKNA